MKESTPTNGRTNETAATFLNLTNDAGKIGSTLVHHVNKEYSEIDILRKAYELILENSDMFFTELEKSFRVERENGEFNPLI